MNSKSKVNYTKWVRDEFVSRYFGRIRPISFHVIDGILDDAKEAEKEYGIDKAYEVFKASATIAMYETVMLYNVAEEIYQKIKD